MTNRVLETQELPLPSIYDPKRAGEVWLPNYGETAATANNFARTYKIVPAAESKSRVALLIIDNQIGFCIPGAPMYVGGKDGQAAIEDTRRITEFIYRNLNVITTIIPTFDTHEAWQIFHPTMWVDSEGNNPAPFTPISVSEVEQGKWKISPTAACALFNDKNKAEYLQAHALHYVQELARKGKYNLTIWPYHELLGSVEHALVPTLHQAIFFHEIARSTTPKMPLKGENALTEFFSAIGAQLETTHGGAKIASRNDALVTLLLEHDAVFVAGQAKSHCVAWTIEDLLSEIESKDKSLAKKLYLLEDCASPIVVPGVIDYTPEADRIYSDFARRGANVIKSADSLRVMGCAI